MKTRGFIALTSAIIISAILMVVILTGSLAGFYSRYNMLDVELKERSGALADACVNAVLLNLARDSSYAGPLSGTTNVAVGNDSCQIYPALNGLGTPRTFVVQGIYQRSYTSIKFSADPGSLVLTAWQELPTYP